MALGALDTYFRDPATHKLDDPADRAAVTHLLKGPHGPGLTALILDAEPGRLFDAIGPSESSTALLTAAILRVAIVHKWDAPDLGDWLHAQFASVPDTSLASRVMDVLAREASGDATARPSLPPELRDLVPALPRLR
jgi:hypothetical protein